MTKDYKLQIKKKQFFIVGTLVGIITALSFFLISLRHKNQPFLSPLSETIVSPLHDVSLVQSTSPKIVYGFLPYWQAKTFTRQPELTHLAYFSLTLSGDGTVKTKEKLATDPGYRFYNSEQFTKLLNDNKKSSVDSELVISVFDNEDIETLLQSTKAQEQALETIKNVLLDSQIQGINLDVEYSGEQAIELQKPYAQFVESIDTLLTKQFPTVSFSIDMYPSGIEGKNVWNVETFSQYVDYIIVMAYDFHRSSSTTSGPVAPLVSNENDQSEKNISRYVGQFLKIVPKEKILLGIPFYGYEWQVVSNEPRSQTYPKTGSTASYQRVQNILDSSNELTGFEHMWEYTTLSPYIIFEEQGKQKVIYYENEQSLQYKLDFVRQSELAGIAIWALGYEGDDRTLWSAIHEKL